MGLSRNGRCALLLFLLCSFGRATVRCVSAMRTAGRSLTRGRFTARRAALATPDPEFHDRQRKVSGYQPASTVSLPEASISRASYVLSCSTPSDTQSSRIRTREFVNTSLSIGKTSLLRRRSLPKQGKLPYISSIVPRLRDK